MTAQNSSEGLDVLRRTKAITVKWDDRRRFYKSHMKFLQVFGWVIHNYSHMHINCPYAVMFFVIKVLFSWLAYVRVMG